MSNNEYYETKLRPLVQIIAQTVAEDPTIAADTDRLMATLADRIPGFNKKEECVNCEASMAIYENNIDTPNCLLLIAMERIVRERVRKGVPFTEANKIRVSSSAIHHTQKCRTTKCSKLGLIAMAGNASWAITDRGFDLLRNRPVPKSRTTFRDKILERPEETTTMSKVFAEHKALMDNRQARGRSLKDDHRADFAEWHPGDWIEIAGYQEGKLF